MWQFDLKLGTALVIGMCGLLQLLLLMSIFYEFILTFDILENLIKVSCYGGWVFWGWGDCQVVEWLVC
jgi:hypothetical protein